jgi:acid phosphatase
MNQSTGSWKTSLLHWAAAGVLLSLVLTSLGCGGTASAGSAGTVPTTSTAPSQPTVSLSATPSTIPAGQTATLAWQTQNASTVTLNGAAVSGTGTQTVTPAQTTTYTLVATGAGGTQQASTTVTVAALPTVTFTATPNSIQQGQSSVLAWQTTNATAVTLDGTAVATSGSLTVSPAKTAYYDLVATGTGGTQKVTVGVTVIGSASAHVAIIVMENRAYSAVIGNTSAAPYMNSLANTYALATNYYANSLGSSLPDYFMLTVGDTVTTTASYTGTITEDNVVRELNKAGRTWKAYAEDLPSAGDISMSNAGTDSAGLPAYVYIHNPFIFLCDVNGKSQSSCPVPYDPAQAMNVVPYTQLAADIASGNLPDYIFIIPNNCHNTHDCSLNTGDSWLAANVPPLLNSSAFQGSGIVIVTFDESETDTTNGGGHIPTIIAGPTVKTGYRSTTFYQHQSTLRLMMKALGVFSYPNAAAAAPDMDEFFSVPLP